jgi:hypothetical protein
VLPQVPQRRDCVLRLGGGLRRDSGDMSDGRDALLVQHEEHVMARRGDVRARRRLYDDLRGLLPEPKEVEQLVLIARVRHGAEPDPAHLGDAVSLADSDLKALGVGDFSRRGCDRRSRGKSCRPMKLSVGAQALPRQI